MNLKIITLRKQDNQMIRALEDEYLKRMMKYCAVELIDIKRERDGISKKREEKETQKVIAHLKNVDFCCVLSERGKQYTSSHLAQFIEKRMHEGLRSMAFVIGSPSGTGDELDREADALLSLSPLTLPHHLARLFLIEALYRSFDILNNGPYHRA